MSSSDFLNKIFADRWTEIALICDHRQFTYQELYGLALALSLWLKENGCYAGDAVALKLANSWIFVVAYLACVLGRYKIIPVNVELNLEDQTYILSRTTPNLILENEDVVQSLTPLLPSKPCFSLKDTDIAAIFFTSGTTGRPKGVAHRLGSLVNNVLSFNSVHGLDETTRMYHCLPMAYMAGFLNTLLSPLLAGGVILLGPRFKPANALQFWTRPLQWQANAIWLTPTLASVLTRVNRDQALARKVGSMLKLVFCGTAPLPEKTRINFKVVFGCPLQESYGMSEVLLVSAQTRQDALDQLGVGRPLPEISLSKRSVSDLGIEELIIHTPWALDKYLLEDGESSPLLPENGMPSGDLGFVDRGYLVINGRIKDLIIRGGLNVSPRAVETVLLREPGVQDVAVLGITHEFWGEEIVACISPVKGWNYIELEKSLQVRSLQELAEGTRPDRFLRVDDLPRNLTGKVQKHVLQSMLT